MEKMASPSGNLDEHVQAMAGLRGSLLKSAMSGDWQTVVEIYNNNPAAYTAQIASSGDTALHIAVRNEEEDVVVILTNVMSKSSPSHAKLAVRQPNEGGNTALHIAAFVGNARMCRCIAEIDPLLVGVRNRNGETPFFLAAFGGRYETFLLLLDFCGHDDGRNYYRKANGDTILHAAIDGEHFDLAFGIIDLYEELAYSRNEEGMDPLQILATKPTAFRSGTHLGSFHKIIYHCITVNKLNKKIIFNDEEFKDNNKHVYPANYGTCMNFFRLLKELLTCCIFMFNGNPRLRGDPENQQGHLRSDKRSIPPNYYTCFEIIKFVSRILLATVGLGYSIIYQLKEVKEKHTWSVQIMEELVERVGLYDFVPSDHNGDAHMEGAMTNFWEGVGIMFIID